MSLQVWLPLNGNLDNQGISGLTFSNTSISANSNGKIGSCYDNDSYSIGGMVSNETILLGNNQSMFCWVNFDSLNSASNLGGAMCGQHRYANNTGMGLTLKYISYTTGYFSINTGTGSSRTFNAYYNSTLLSAGNWYHVGYTYDGNVVKLYLNGELDGVYTIGTLSNPEDYIQVFSWSFNSSSGNGLYSNYHLNGRLNDVRIYDHCLSAKEVKEIAQGLVLHYKLDNNGIGNPNLITSMSAGGRTTLVNNYELLADFSQDTDTYGYINVSPSLENGKTYTLSFDVENFPSNATWGWALWNDYDYHFDISSNGHKSYTFTLDVSKLPSDYSLSKFLFDDWQRVGAANQVTLKNFKLEEGSKATTWCPNLQDKLAIQLGMNNNNLSSNSYATEITSSNEYIQLSGGLKSIYEKYGLVKYTVSFDAKSAIAGDFALYGTDGYREYAFNSTSISLTTDWQHFKYTYTPYLTGSEQGYEASVALYGTYGTGKIVSVRKVKIELGDKETPWCPSFTDISYTGLSDYNIEKDCSGYSYDGVKKTSTIISSSDTIKYKSSSHFTSDYIETALVPKNWKEFASTVYIKLDDLNNRAVVYSNYYADNVGPFIEIEIYTGVIRIHFEDDIGTLVSWMPRGSFQANKWYFMALTYKNNIFTLYIKPIEDAWEKYTNTVENFNCVTSYYNSLRIGKMYNYDSYYFNGNMSDFRIYSTALSEEDIKSLYETSASVDKSGNLHCYQLVEE